MNAISHIHQNHQTQTNDLYTEIIAWIIIAELSKEPEYICEICGRIYKQETRYHSHIQTQHPPQQSDSVVTGNDHGGVNKCVVNDTRISDDIVVELLRQNRDMMEMIKQQQDTIALLIRQNYKNTS